MIASAARTIHLAPPLVSLGVADPSTWVGDGLLAELAAELLAELAAELVRGWVAGSDDPSLVRVVADEVMIDAVITPLWRI